MKKIQKYKTVLIICFLTGIVAMTLVGPYLFTRTPFILGWDMRTQYSLFFENLKTMLSQSITEHSLPFYSWSTFLGNNFWAAKLFYYHDLFDYLFAAFRTLSYSNVGMIQTCIKVLIAALCFNYYSLKRGHKPTARIIGSLLFAFSAWSLEAVKDPFFLSFYVFLPLYFAAVDHYFETGKKVMYILITAFLAITNYYSFYSLSLFTVLYFSYYHYRHTSSLKGLFRSAMPLIGAYLIAVMIASIALIPEFSYILANERIGKTSSLLFFNSLKPYLSILTGLFTPTSILINRNNDFTSVFQYVTANESVLSVCLWSGSLTALLLPQIFSKKRKENTILYSLFILLMLIPLGSSLMHGFSEPSYRWFQLVTFFNITMILPYLDHPENLQKKRLWISLGMMVILLISVVPMLGIIEGLRFTEIQKEYTFILLSVSMLILAAVLLVYKPKPALLLFFTLAELCGVTYLSVYDNSYYRQFSREMINGVENVLMKKDDLNQYLLTLDPDNVHHFYRIYVPASSIYWDYSTNLNMKYNLMGLMTYDSTYSPAILDMNKITPIDSYLPWSFEINDPYVIDYLCTRYAVVTDDSQLPHSDFIRVGEFNGLPVYENTHWVNLIRSYTKVITYDEYANNPNSELILDTLIVNSKDLDQIRQQLGSSTNSGFDWLVRRQNSLIGEFTSDTAGMAAVAIPYDPGWKILVNDESVHVTSANGGTMAIPINEGINTIEMYFVPRGFKLGCILSGIGLLFLCFLFWKEKRTKNK